MSQSVDRKHPRYEFSQLPFVLSIRWDEAPTEDKPLRIEGRNLSRSGLKFVSNRRIALFSPVHLSLFERNQGQLLADLEAKVVRVEEVDTGLGERTYGIAVEFLSGHEALDPILPPAANSNPAT